MATFLFTKPSTGEMVHIYASHRHEAADKFGFDRVRALTPIYEAEGKIVTKVRVIEDVDGKWEMGGVRYAVKVTSKAKSVDAGQERYDSRQLSGRGEWVGGR